MEEALVIKDRPISLTGRRHAYVFLILAFACPFLFFSFYAFSSCSTDARVGVVMMTILAMTVGGGCGYYVLKGWEERMQSAVAALVEQKCSQMRTPEQLLHVEQQVENLRLGYEHQIDLLQSSVVKSKQEVSELHLEMDKKLEYMRVAYLEFEDLRRSYHALEEEYARYQAEIQGQIKHKESLFADYQKTISEQRDVIEKKQGHIGKLEGKVRDLMYEIRSLLQLEDPTKEKDLYVPDPQKGKPYDFSLQLGQFLELAESFTGADHLGGRFLNSGAHRYAIDLRPLCDRLSQETQRLVFVYSQSEERFLFVGESVRHRLGWGADKVIKDFPQLVVKGYREWKEAISHLTIGGQKVLPLIVRHKIGQEVPLDCYMGLISKGPFAQHVIGLFV